MVRGHLSAFVTSVKTRLKQAVLRHRVAARHPTMSSHPTAIWDYAYRDLDSIEIGKNAIVCAYCEILVYRQSPHSNTEGRLILGDGAIITTGCNIRAAGGTIEIGRNSGVGQNTVVVAANHSTSDKSRLTSGWDETRTGVILEDNVWVGANCVLLPGTRIGRGSIIAAGAVVGGEVPAGEVWGGVPARRIKAVTESAPALTSDDQ